MSKTLKKFLVLRSMLVPTEIENTGWSAFCCAEKDKFSTGFKAKDKEGNIVEGCFCSGFLKRVTIRFE